MKKSVKCALAAIISLTVLMPGTVKADPAGTGTTGSVAEVVEAGAAESVVEPVDGEAVKADPAGTEAIESAAGAAETESMAEAVEGEAAMAEALESGTAESAIAYIDGKTFPYLFQFSEAEKYPSIDEMRLYFVDGGDIPYVALSEFMPFLSDLYSTLGMGRIIFDIREVPDDRGNFFEISRPDNGSVLCVYPKQDTMIFENYNTFIQSAGSRALVSTMHMPEAEEVDMIEYLKKTGAYQALDEEGREALDDAMESPADDESLQGDESVGKSEEEAAEPSLFTLKDGTYVNRAGDIITLDLADYDIDIVAAQGECFVPFQTMNDLLVNMTYMQFVFDGEKVLGSAYGCSLIDEMDSAEKHELSEEMALFNYNELRLLLDCKYGLKPEHGIEDFETFLNVNTNLGRDLASTDPMRASLTLTRLLYLYFDDLHSGFIRGSGLYERDEEMEQAIIRAYLGPSIRRSIALNEIYSEARKKYYRAWVPGYEEVDDTAFITFDSFTSDRLNYYAPGIDYDDPKDTIDLIIYANREIRREGSPVKNIVVDLSNNGGGAANAAIFLISWLLGEADIAMRDTFTGAETNAMYLADVNLDGKYDENDNVAEGYRLYCLTSNSSFSCGNLVPAACMSSGRVTLVGQTTGGGSCVVLPCTTAAGAVFQMSGNAQISIIRNGSFYNTDAGIEPHFYLEKPESFYDRPALVEYLHELR